MLKNSKKTSRAGGAESGESRQGWTGESGSMHPTATSPVWLPIRHLKQGQSRRTVSGQYILDFEDSLKKVKCNSPLIISYANYLLK